jgi:hypothetical protein
MIKEKRGKSGKSGKKNGDNDIIGHHRLVYSFFKCKFWKFLLVFLCAILSFVILYSKIITENPA